MPAGSMMQNQPEFICDTLKQQGYDAVEWPLAFFCPEKRDDAYRRRVCDATANAGLLLSEVVLQQDYILIDESARQQAIDYTILCIERFAQAGVKTMNIFTGPIPWKKNPLRIGEDISPGQAWAQLFYAMDRILPAAGKHGMRLALENVWGMLCHDFFSAQTLMKKYPSPNLGVCFDPSHDILQGNMDVGWIARQWGSSIFHVHAKDAAGIQTQGRYAFPLLGDGLVNWKGFFDALRDIGYKGVVSVEFEAFAYLAQILEDDMEKASALSIGLLKKLIAL
jgi:sugar phosphate isomerase/epimerase